MKNTHVDVVVEMCGHSLLIASIFFYMKKEAKPSEEREA